MARSSDDCSICFTSTVATTADRKRLVLLGTSAQPVRDVIKSCFMECLEVRNFPFEAHFHAGDFLEGHENHTGFRPRIQQKYL